jgi:hypothetical protein
MSWPTIIMGFFSVGFIGLAIRSVVSWIRQSKDDAARTEYLNAEAKSRATAARSAGDILRQKAESDANKVLATLPLDPSDEEADRLLREAEDRLRR